MSNRHSLGAGAIAFGRSTDRIDVIHPLKDDESLDDCLLHVQEARELSRSLMMQNLFYRATLIMVEHHLAQDKTQDARSLLDEMMPHVRQIIQQI